MLGCTRSVWEAVHTWKIQPKGARPGGRGAWAAGEWVRAVEAYDREQVRELQLLFHYLPISPPHLPISPLHLAALLGRSLRRLGALRLLQVLGRCGKMWGDVGRWVDMRLLQVLAHAASELRLAPRHGVPRHACSG